MEHITFAELAKIVIDNMPGSTQEEKLTKLFKWLANDHVDPKAISISKTTASRILNGGYSKKVSGGKRLMSAATVMAILSTNCFSKGSLPKRRNKSSTFVSG